MDRGRELPKRKHPRLNYFDYSMSGAYFVTICTQNRRCTLSRVVGRGLAPADVVGRGLAPAEESVVEYTTFGEIARKQLLLLEERYPFLSVDQYVIMPNHIHVILLLGETTAGASPRPTVMDIVCAYKSLTMLECKKNGLTGKLFQTSFYDHIIRGRGDYEKIAKYIHENPARWHYDELYSKE